MNEVHREGERVSVCVRMLSVPLAVGTLQVRFAHCSRRPHPRPFNADEILLARAQELPSLLLVETRVAPGEELRTHKMKG